MGGTCIGYIAVTSAWSLWSLYNTAQPLVDFANSLSTYYGGQTIGYSATDKLFIFIAIATLLLEAVVLLMAFKPLQQKLKRGWDLLFIALLINVIYAVVTIFIDGRGAGSFILQMVGSAVGLYFLFQIRELYSLKASKNTKA